MARIGNNVYERKDGRFEGRYIKGRKENGRPNYAYVYGSTYEDAKKKLDAAKEKAGLRQKAPAGITAAQWLDRWLGLAGIFISGTALGRYSSVISEHLSPALGEMELAELDSKTVNGFLRESGLSKDRWKDTVFVLKSVMRLAETEYGIPAISDRIMAATRKSHPNRVLTKEQQACLTSAALNKGDQLGIGTLLILYTGLRIGELCALRWEDLGLETSVLSIRRSVRRVNSMDESGRAKSRVIIGEPGFKAAVRDIPIPLSLTEHLTKYRHLHIPADYILTGRPDKFAEPSNAEYHFVKLVKAAGLEGISLGMLRGTFQGRCREADMDLQVMDAIWGRKASSHSLTTLPGPSMEQKRESMERLVRGWISRDFFMEVSYE